ncbi:unnamed protein product [Didymodactylos carnosus]|uniref:Methyltransferase FkbM domain-containing protein n=1 Tax=Didymodactylos carnosus TaxID=1234261 RepID=A0A8S2FMA0_9BILA|nr:unnamed protein product [Didymodactylos carnosus]CAF4285418.1 unnamed protein product [Didymodactylos carnosus]
MNALIYQAFANHTYSTASTQNINKQLCNNLLASYHKCVAYSSSLANNENVDNGWEMTVVLRRKLGSQPLTNASLYWNENDRFKRLNNLSSTNCKILYNGAHKAGTDGLRFLRDYPSCRVWFLEPIPAFFNSLIHSHRIAHELGKQRGFAYNIGLSKANANLDISSRDLSDDQGLTLIGKTSQKNSTNKNQLVIRDISEILFEYNFLSRELPNPGEFDLLHMNCEGCEYDVLERLIETNLIRYIRIIQFGSHRPKAIRATIDQRYCCIQQQLTYTHEKQFGIPWGWERWNRRN